MLRRQEIIKSRHCALTAGHPGRSKTFELVSRNFFWPGMRQDIYDFVDSCDTCPRIKAPRHKPFGLLQPLPIPNRPWSSLSMDFIVKLPLSSGFDSIFVVVCRLTKQAHFIPCNETINSVGLVDLFISNVVRLHGFPDDIISDRGPVFRSNFWRSLLDKFQVKTKLSSAFHPQTDGQTERVNQILEQYLRGYICFSQDNWSYLLPFAEFAYNNSVSSSTSFSPFYANYGFHPKMDFIQQDLSSTPVPAVFDHLKAISSLRVALHSELQSAQARMKVNADKLRKDHSFYVNDYVWLLNKNIRTARPSLKLDHKRLGPFKIIEQINPVTFRLDLPIKYKIWNAFHVSLLEPVSAAFLASYSPTPPPILVEGQEEYFVDKILDSKIVDGVELFLVRWAGFTDADDTWEPFENLTDSSEALRAFRSTI